MIVTRFSKACLVQMGGHRHVAFTEDFIGDIFSPILIENGEPQRPSLDVDLGVGLS